MTYRLSLKNNQLTGSIPTSLSFLPFVGNSSNASITALGKRYGRQSLLELNNNSLSGPIPVDGFSMSGMSGLEGFFLQENNLTGSIPIELGQLSSVDNLYLNNNSLSGPIPTELGQLSLMKDFRLDYNHLTGPLPSELGLFSHLINFDVASNEMTGKILFLGNTSSLEYLNISHNGFSGTLPADICNLDSWMLGFDCNASVLCGCNCNCTLDG